MIPKVKKILYATDLSENARYAFSYAADLAQRYDAKMTILYVMESFYHPVENDIKTLLGQEKWDSLKSEKKDYLAQKIQTRIEDFCHEMDSQIDSCRLLVEDILTAEGHPTEKILNISKDIDADMIVMGTYGHNIIKDTFIGRTAKTVVKNSDIPVLIVKLPKE